MLVEPVKNMSKLWVVVVHDMYIPDTVVSQGIFSTREKAEDAIYSILKTQFESSKDTENLKRDKRLQGLDLNEATWNDVRSRLDLSGGKIMSLDDEDVWEIYSHTLDDAPVFEAY